MKEVIKIFGRFSAIDDGSIWIINGLLITSIIVMLVTIAIK
jgi:hypothetical protein